MPVPIAALDADVLVPIIGCDFLLTSFDHQLYEPIVSTTVLDEVQRTLLNDFSHIDPTAIHHRVASMRLALEDQLVDDCAMDVPDNINAKDRHIVDAALQGEATFVVTNDRRLRREIDASGLELLPIDLDTFAIKLWASSPSGVRAVVNSLAAKRQRHPVSTAEMVETLAQQMPALVMALGK